MAGPFRTTRLVEFSDTDMAGIVHFSAFFRYMESAEHAFLRSLGLSVFMEWDGEPIGFPRVAAACEFRKPVRFEEELTITVAVEKLGRSSVTYAFGFTKAGEEVARGRITAVCCTPPAGSGLTAREIPAAVRAKLEAYRQQEAPDAGH
jgi:YbgC/YbaW family acyl-CoA thioester hydrolase